MELIDLLKDRLLGVYYLSLQLCNVIDLLEGSYINLEGDTFYLGGDTFSLGGDSFLSKGDFN